MKKVFLSLATIAFVAAGSLTVTSCGGDDSTPTPGPGPGPEPGTQAENTVRFDGVDSALDFSYYELVTRNYELVDEEGQPTGETVENVNVYQYPDGGYANGYYVNVGYNMTETGADTYHYAFILVPNSSIVVTNGSITSFGTPVMPHQAEDIYWAQAAVQIGDKEFASAQGNVGTGSVTVNTLVLNEELEGTSNLVSQFSIDGSNFNFKFNGSTFLTYYNVSTAAKSAKNNMKNQMLGNMKDFEVKTAIKK